MKRRAFKDFNKYWIMHSEERSGEWIWWAPGPAHLKYAPSYEAAWQAVEQHMRDRLSAIVWRP